MYITIKLYKILDIKETVVIINFLNTVSKLVSS